MSFSDVIMGIMSIELTVALGAGLGLWVYFGYTLFIKKNKP